MRRKLISNSAEEHCDETAFLKHCILYDDTLERQQLEDGITQAHRDERCVRRALWLMVVFMSTAVAGLYGTPDALVNNWPFLLNGLCALGLASFVCLIAFLGFWLRYRKKLNRRRVECRQFVAKLLHSAAKNKEPS